MNILIKLMSIVSLVIAPTLAQIAAKKQIILPPSAGGRSTGMEKKIQSTEPVASINKANTVTYQ